MKKNIIEKRAFDYPLLLIVFLLVGIGLIAILSASAPYAYLRYGDHYYFLKNQLKWLMIGLALMWLASRFNYQKYRLLSIPILFLTLALLVLVLIPGVGKEIRGVHRWIILKGFTLQPSEIAKIGIVIYLSSSLVRKREKIRSFFNGFLPYFIIIGVIFLLIAVEPDLGTATIIALVAFILLYAGGVKVSHLFYALVLSLIPLYFFVFEVGYRKARIIGFLYPEKHSQGIAFQPLHLKISLGSGGLWGLGPGQGKEKLFYLPTPHTDSIFAVIGEEFGFIGTSVVVILFFLLALWGFKVFKRAPDELGKLLALGMTCMICVQAFINMGVATVLLPTTGTTLPFISYGGSSLVINLIAIGILLSISRKGKDKDVRGGDKGKGKDRGDRT